MTQSSSQTQTAECFEQIVNNRRSIRGFKPDPVDPEILNKIFQLAQRAPSNCNTQPWQIHVASGESLETLRKAMPANTMQAKFTLDFPYEPKYHGVYQDRQYDAANQMYGSLNIERADKAARNEVFMRNYTFFGAPHVAFLFLPEPFGLREAADVGLYAQTLMLALTAFGVGSIPQTSLSYHADLVREVLNINPSNKLIFGISFGYENTEDPINNTRMGRAELSETTVFHN